MNLPNLLISDFTAASSSSINDGAAALVMMRASTAAKLGCKPLARIVAHAMHAQEPEWFTTAPVGATQKALAKAGWSVKDVQLWEVNEAFAVVPMALKSLRDAFAERTQTASQSLAASTTGDWCLIRAPWCRATTNSSSER